jgi:hypothetical protein
MRQVNLLGVCGRHLLGVCGRWSIPSIFLSLNSFLFLLLILIMILVGMSGSAEIAFWTATRHLVRKAAGYAPDQATHVAYEAVIAHTEERAEHFLQANKVTRPYPPTSPAPKSA